MMRPRRNVGPRAAATVGLHVVLAALLGCGEGGGPLPDPDSPEYEEVVSEFYLGVAALEVGEDARAERSLERVVELAPGEPAAPANLAILALRQRRLDDAAEWIARARRSGASGPRLAILAALVERERGNLGEAIAELQPAATGDDPDRRARFLLHQLLEQRGAPGDVEASRDLLEAMLDRSPDHTFLRVASARHAARHGHDEALGRELDWLAEAAESWPAPIREQLDRVRGVKERPTELAGELVFLAASLDAEGGYTRERYAVSISEQQPDLVFTRFFRLPTPSSRPADPDMGLRFVERVIDPGAGRPSDSWLDARPLWLNGTGPARIGLSGHGTLLLVGAAAAPDRLPVAPAPGVGESRPGVVPLDVDGDFRMDLAVVGSEGVQILLQTGEGEFRELEDDAVPATVREGEYGGAWAVDADVDGDLDLILAPAAGAPVLLRNQGDGTFTDVSRFQGLAGPTRLVWGDLDRDGVPDAVFLDGAGRVHGRLNPRQNRPLFEPVDLPEEVQSARAIGLGDMNGNGRLDLVVLRQDGTLLLAHHGREEWETREAAHWRDMPEGAEPGNLFVVDLDNNGALDVVASVGGRTQSWLSDSDYELVPHQALELTTTAAADLGAGRIELLGVDQDGRPLRLSPAPTLNYYSLTLSPRATTEPGDGRINTFGIGGEAEVRAGLLYQKQLITQPVVHFGLGSNTGASVARILWPNGTTQAEFDILATSEGEPIVAQQRLKGSCPWLFTFDGEGMTFVTDLAWRTALGLRINAYGSSAVIQSQDWVRIRGDQLEPRDGRYELSITADLWESHFFDYLALKVVDHPEGTEALVDERFFLPPPELGVHATGPLMDLAGARDHRGRDVLPILAELDQKYVDGFRLGRFQGVAREEHFVEVDLGPDAPVDAPLVLVAQGWVFPTDGSLNLALGQGANDPPRGIRVDIPDGDGGWRVLHEDLGMPAGKTKTVLVDLEGAFRHDAPRRVRLATTMEIYWDRITWAETIPEPGFRITRLHPSTADLQYRGFSRSHKPDRRSPELPEWEVATTMPRWRDLEGYHTRFGDVLPLLDEIDDRYVIMNAGDELRLEFEALPDPPEGWVRSYVFITEAWVKDGDFNNGFSSTLLPLPYQGMTDYSTPPGRLEDDPVYQRYPEDWRRYHTRYVSSEAFDHALSTR